MLALQDIINLLDRKYEFLMQSKRKDFMLDLANFVKFLTEHDQVKDFTMKIYSEFVEEHKKYENIQAKEKKSIVAITNKIREKYPEIDDSNITYPGANKSSTNYNYSFAAFNDVVNGVKKRESFTLDPDMMTDESDVKKMLNIVNNKIAKYEGRDEQGNKIRNIDEDIFLEVTHLNDQREYNFRKWLNSCRVSAGNAIAELYRLVSRINPEPKKHKSTEDRFKELTSIELMKSIHFEGWIEDATYGVISKYSNYKPSGLNEKQIDEIFEKLKYKTKRIYAAVREEIGTHLIHRQLLNRYKTRCIWYDFEELWKLVTDEKGKFTNKKEKTLTLHLARYLFDNGISVIYRLKAGRHEMDMVAPDSKSPLLIEVKAYNGSYKSGIIDGLVQLHSYLNNLSSAKNVQEAFYVVYRFGGPLYEMPEKINTNQFTMNTTLIDVGSSNESGRKQKRSEIIMEKEIKKKLGIKHKS